MPDLPRPAARIYYIHPLLAGPLESWDSLLDHAAAMGFSTVLSAPLFDPSPQANVFLAGDFERLHPALGFDGSPRRGIEILTRRAEARGLEVMFDLVTDRVVAGSALAQSLGVEARHPRAARDPRIPPDARHMAEVELAPGHPFLEMVVQQARVLTGAGVAGFRCFLGPGTSPEIWQGLISEIRGSAPDCRFFAWGEGLDRAHLERLAKAGFDSLCFAAGGENEEAPRLPRGFAQAIACPEAPFGPRLSRRFNEPAEAAAGLRRALWSAAGLGDGLLLPLGFEFAARERLQATCGAPTDFARLRENAPLDVTTEVAAANAFLARGGTQFAGPQPLHPPGARLAAFLRTDSPNPGRAERARLILVNRDLQRSAEQSGTSLLRRAAGFSCFEGAVSGNEPDLTPGGRLHLNPGEVRILEAEKSRPIRLTARREPHSVETATAAPRLAIEAVTPRVEDGRFAVKRLLGEIVRIEADIFGDGHDQLAAVLLWRAEDEEAWRESPMTPLGNDRWTAEMPLERLGRHLFTIEAWRDDYATYRSELEKKHAAGVSVGLELREGRTMVEEAAKTAPREAAAQLQEVLGRLPTLTDHEAVGLLLSEETKRAMAAADPRPFALRHKPLPIDAERQGAAFASWYELFPRSQSGDPARHGTFRDVENRLPEIREMGFDVLYFTPIHPIGRTNRKGRNNALKAGPDDPGSPYAIGSEEGGHDAIHPELGTLEDFRRLVRIAADHGLEIALDFAIQCSPDHPWLKDHPEWFDWRPDGTVRFAENPPKKYEDIVNVDFYAPGALPSLWLALRDVVLFWVGEGVRLFRVDNPHTKPFPFWEWLIDEVRSEHPDVVFLAEAFTRPKVMYRLAKLGFSQSYTYFTWRNSKAELQDYLTELTTTAPKDFFRPHFFVNTPDINPEFLHSGKRAAFLIRAALATTLSGLWGMYNGFELCEGRALPGKEEYLDSEKYEIKAWDYDRPGNIKAEIARLNAIRKANPALQSHLGVRFHQATNDRILYFAKATEDWNNVVLVAVSLDPEAAQEATIEVPLWEWGLPDHGVLGAEDLMNGARFTWHGKHQRIRLDPAGLPFSIWRIFPASEV